MGSVSGPNSLATGCTSDPLTFGICIGIEGIPGIVEVSGREAGRPCLEL